MRGYNKEMQDFSKYLVKEYEYWVVSIHIEPSYLGQCVIWCKREDALDLADSTMEEQQELFVILKKLRKATKKAFNSDWFNYSFLGNETRHVHCHFIPRYSSHRQFGGMTFVDKRWGFNYYDENSDLNVPQKILEFIRLAIIKELE
jgi:diadenosine tetraphosphate (Ap4A) HIT family hydrolase